MTKKQKKMLSRILISAVLFLLLYTVPAQGVVRLLLYLHPLCCYRRGCTVEGGEEHPQRPGL